MSTTSSNTPLTKKVKAKKLDTKEVKVEKVVAVRGSRGNAAIEVIAVQASEIVGKERAALMTAMFKRKWHEEGRPKTPRKNKAVRGSYRMRSSTKELLNRAVLLNQIDDIGSTLFTRTEKAELIELIRNTESMTLLGLVGDAIAENDNLTILELLDQLRNAGTPPEAIIYEVASDRPPIIEAGAKTDLLKLNGGTLGTQAFAKTVGITRQAVDKLANSGKLLRFKKGARNWQYPVWQSHDGGLLPGWKDALKALLKQDRSHWSIVIFMNTDNDYLEGVLADEMGTNDITPIQALRDGYKVEVLGSIKAKEQ